MNKYNGPWEVIASSKPGNGTGWRDIVTTTGPYAPTYVGEAFEDNARLISAAPDLLAALQELLSDKYLADPINAGRMANARLAVSKATGRIETI